MTSLRCVDMGQVQAGSTTGEINRFKGNTTGDYCQKALALHADCFVKLPLSYVLEQQPSPQTQCPW